MTYMLITGRNSHTDATNTDNYIPTGNEAMTRAGRQWWLETLIVQLRRILKLDQNIEVSTQLPKRIIETRAINHFKSSL